jgi:hypothetical protein
LSGKTLDEQIEQAMAEPVTLSGIGHDARDGLKAWRLTNPKEFNAKVDAVAAEVKAIRRMLLPLNARRVKLQTKVDKMQKLIQRLEAPKTR